MSKTATIIALGRANVEEAFGTNFGAQRFPEDHDALHGWAGPRPPLELNRNFLQPIPYVLVKAKLGGDRYIAYRRGQQGNEERLKDKLSVGIGGHVDARHAVYRADDSIDVMASVRDAAVREMSEEIGVGVNPEELQLLGLIHTDVSDVDRVHLGFVFLWEADEFLDVGGQFIFEPGIDQVAFMTRDQIFGPDTELENWSRLALDLL